MESTTAAVIPRRSGTETGRRGVLARVLGVALMIGLLVPLVMTLFVAPAHAAGDDDDEGKDYSLYKLSSNAANYFSTETSPEGANSDDIDKWMKNDDKRWYPVTNNPGSAGSVLGYADDNDSTGDKVKSWLMTGDSGSAQTIGYKTLQFRDPDHNNNIHHDYKGLLDYVHFGATNSDLGLDRTSDGINPMGSIVSAIAGSSVMVVYSLTLFVQIIFTIAITLMKLANPFNWFYQGVKAVAPDSWAVGMVTGTTSGGKEISHTTLASSDLNPIQKFIGTWYSTIVDLSWTILVPIFLAVLIFSIVAFKNLNKGSAIKKFVVRIAFLAFGLPILGSLYTTTLDKFSDLGSEGGGPTKVVLSNYVDFNAWMMNDRLAVPDDAILGWDNNQASAKSTMAARNTALAINVQSHGDDFKGIEANSFEDGVEVKKIFKDTSKSLSDNGDDITNENASKSNATTVFNVLDMISRYMGNREISAADFESGIKSNLTSLGEGEGGATNKEARSAWFVGKGYGESDSFGESGSPAPKNHAIIATKPGTGLTSSSGGSNKTEFTTRGDGVGCGFATATKKGVSSDCNLAPLSAYNYLNTKFNPSSYTVYSSQNSSSGSTRAHHMQVNQVGSGPTKFMYWSNTVVLLGSIAVLGLWYAIGMFVGSLKRVFSLIAAIPFATLGALAAIAKVVSYSMALILEVLVTMFIYQFVSEFLMSVPNLITGPVSSLMGPKGLLGYTSLGGTAIFILTLMSSILIVAITIVLIKVRKSVLQMLDEAITKFIDKFLETNTPPKPGGGAGGGLKQAAASGAGAGLGMAAGKKLGDKLGGGGGNAGGSGDGGGGSGTPEGVPQTSAGGTDAQAKQVGAGPSRPGIEGPKSGGKDGGPKGSGSPSAGGTGSQKSAGGSASAESGRDGKDGTSSTSPDGNHGGGSALQAGSEGPSADGPAGPGSETPGTDVAAMAGKNSPYSVGSSGGSDVSAGAAGATSRGSAGGTDSSKSPGASSTNGGHGGQDQSGRKSPGSGGPQTQGGSGQQRPAASAGGSSSGQPGQRPAQSGKGQPSQQFAPGAPQTQQGGQRPSAGGSNRQQGQTPPVQQGSQGGATKQVNSIEQVPSGSKGGGTPRPSGGSGGNTPTQGTHAEGSGQSTKGGPKKPVDQAPSGSGGTTPKPPTSQ